MKKHLAALLTVCMMLSMFTACSSRTPDTGMGAREEAAQTENSGGAGEETAQTDNEGMGDVGFAGGSGTEEDPYQIGDVSQLVAFANSVNDGSRGGHYGEFIRLTADLDLSGVEWVPIGNMNDMETHSTMFLGTFDGGGHTISNLTYESDEFNCGAGLFGINCGVVKDLTVQNAVVTVTEGTSLAIGSVIGYNMGMVENVTVKSSSVTGNNCTGGMIGGNSNGTVAGCTAEDITVTVIGDNDFSEGLVQADVAECGGLLIGGGFGGTVDNCRAGGTIKADGNEPVGLGGIGGCLEMMDSITDCTADVTILSSKGGHAIGGLCGYAGTHSDKDVCLDTEGFSTTNYPCRIDGCTVTVTIEADGATHVGGLVGIGLYYYGEETAFAITGCKVNGEINGAVTPGTIAGRAEGSTVENCSFDLLIDGAAAGEEIGGTSRMYESADQYE
ncbi:MAG: hypothetical protein NC389_17615 [Acetatifactor muris]|nr:hypothetical protein [Acetatifactor muris]